MLVNSVVVITLLLTFWSLWVRRITWGLYWEIGATATMLFMASSCLLMSPVSSASLGQWMCSLTGQNNLDDWIGHCCCIAGTCSFLLHLMIRTNPHHGEWRDKYQRRVNIPLAVVIPTMLVLLCKSPSADRYYDDFFAAPIDGWLKAYWLLVCGTLLYMIGLLYLALFDVRNDDRDTRLAHMYFVALAFAAVGAVIEMIEVLEREPDTKGVCWLCGALATLVFALGTGVSWRHKMHWFTSESASRAWLSQPDDPPGRHEGNPDEPPLTSAP